MQEQYGVWGAWSHQLLTAAWGDPPPTPLGLLQGAQFLFLVGGGR